MRIRFDALVQVLAREGRIAGITLLDVPIRPRLTPAVADIRRAVRASLGGLDPGALLLVALSGGQTRWRSPPPLPSKRRGAGIARVR